MVEVRPEPRGRFTSTRWRLVAQAGEDDPGRKREAIGQLLVQYLPALRAHLICTRHVPADQADDLLQEFVISKVIEKDLFARADQQAGKLRTFLLTVLDRFVRNRLRAETAKKRAPSGGARLVGGDWAECLPCDGEPSEAFDVAWAHGVIAETLKCARAECESSGRMDIWGVFECRILRPAVEGTEPIDYRQLVERFGFQSPRHAANVLITAKRMYVRTLRCVVGQYVDNDEEIDEEIDDLRKILERSSR
jgi:DNA-directed RNA polymerase specialized sigma24 family protein